jgi:hypothetical protein
MALEEKKVEIMSSRSLSQWRIFPAFPFEVYASTLRASERKREREREKNRHGNYSNSRQLLFTSGRKALKSISRCIRNA